MDEMRREELKDAIAKAIADCVGHGMREKCERHADAVMEVIDALLRDRESAKAAVTDGMVDRACEASFAAEGHSFSNAALENKTTWRKCIRAALEAVAPKPETEE